MLVEIVREEVCFAMEDALDSQENMVVKDSKKPDEQDEERLEDSQVIPLNLAYERAGLTPPVPLEKLQAAMASSQEALASAVEDSRRDTAPDIANSERRAPSDEDEDEEEEGDPLINTFIEGYRIEGSISGGGMGVVYRARQPGMQALVAIKVLRADVAASKEQSARFFREAQVLGSIRHQGVTHMTLWGRLEDGRQYIVMEYLDGESLEETMAREGPMPTFRALQIISEVLDALSAAHKVGVVHRDLKPSNIFVAKQSNGTQCIKLLDFGLAKQHALDELSGGIESSMEGGEPRQEKASMVAGTPEYIAPEQAKGLVATPRTDLYSLGVVAFEMLTGELPFHKQQSAVEMMRAHAYLEAPDVQKFAPNVPNALADLLNSMLQKEPENRPHSTDEVKQRIHRILQQLKQEETYVGPLREPRLQEEKRALEEEQLALKVKQSKLKKLWVPATVLPVVTGFAAAIGMYIAMKPDAQPPPPVPAQSLNLLPFSSDMQAFDAHLVEPPKKEKEETTPEKTTPPSPPAALPAKTTKAAPERPRRPPKTTPVASVPLQMREVDCAVDTTVWVGSMGEKLRSYNQRIANLWADEPEYRDIKREFSSHQNEIRNNDGSAATCTNLSKKLDEWLLQWNKKYEQKRVEKNQQAG